MAISRENSLLMPKQWAEDGSTVIPNPPVSGTAYRDESVDADNIAEGQQYDGVADSARWNQLLYIITGILKDTLAHGVLPWLNTQDYSEGAVVMGSNGTLYIAKKATGPSTSNAKNPTTDSGESVWKAVIRLNTATMALDSAGKILAKDVAIGGNVGDLASARGQIGNGPYSNAQDFNTYTKSGVYNLKGVDSAANKPPYATNGTLLVMASSIGHVRQVFFRIGTPTSNDHQIVTRVYAPANRVWSDWVWVLTTKNIGDGIKVTESIISVPEYEGATSSKPGTAGLVPPATAAERDKFLKGDGTYDSIGDGVYVKKTGDTMSNNLVIEKSNSPAVQLYNLGFTLGTDPASNRYWSYSFKDKDGANVGDILAYHNTDANGGSSGIALRILSNDGQSFDTYPILSLVFSKTRNAAYGYAPTPPEDSDGNEIITGEWIKSKLGKSIMPVGAVYVQFANQPDPTSLFGGTWSNISSSFAGLFFRAEGGAAAAFGGSQKGGLPNITGIAEISNSKIGSSVKNFSGALYGVGSYSRGVVASTDLEAQTNLGIDAKKSSAIYGAANEVRPVNSTIRIWKRTA